MEKKTSMDLTVVVMSYQLESFLKLPVIMFAVKCSFLSCWKRETGCLSECLKAVLPLYAAEIPQRSYINSCLQSVTILS